MRVFPLFDSMVTDGPTDRQTDQRTDQWTDKASYRVACPQLKSKFIGCCGAAAAFNTTELNLLINTAVHHTLQPIFAIFRYSSICDSTHRCWYVGLNQMLIFFEGTVEPCSNGPALNGVSQCWTDQLTAA